MVNFSSIKGRIDMSKKIKIPIIISSIIALFVAIILSLYLIVLPKVVATPEVWEYVNKIVKETCGAELVVSNPCLKTSLKPEIAFDIDGLTLIKDGETLLNVKNMQSGVNFAKIFAKEIKLQKFGVDDLYVDMNKLQRLKIKEGEQVEQKPCPIKIDWFDSLLYVKRCIFIYESPQKVMMKFLAGDISLDMSGEPRYLHFKSLLDMEHNKDRLRLEFWDKDTVYIKDKKLIFDKFKFFVNNSEIVLDANFNQDGKYKLDLSSKKFSIQNVDKFMRTNMLVANGSDVMNCFKDLAGDFSFDVKMSDSAFGAVVKVNKIVGKLVPLANIPLTISKGSIIVDPQNIAISDFDGFYGHQVKNKIGLFGNVFDYATKADTNLFITGDAYDELAQHISKLAGIRIAFVNVSKFVIRVVCDVTGKVKVTGGAKVPAGSNVTFEGASISPAKFDRAIGLDLEVLKDKLTINHINYYISENIAQNVAPQKPMVSIKGLVNCYTGYLYNLGFEIPEPLPSEFFNVLVGQTLLKRGTVAGKMDFVNGEKPYLDGEMEIKSVRVSGQSFKINNGKVVAKDDNIHLTADGRFRRLNYKFDGNIKNCLLFPILVKNVNLNIDELDVERVMQTFAPREQRIAQAHKNLNPNRPKSVESKISTKYFVVDDTPKTETKSETSEAVEPIVFQPNLIVVNDCNFNVTKGAYKQIKFGNLHATLTLDKNGLLNVQSNKFDFAEGISTLKLVCDLAKPTYYIRLGANNVDVDVLSTAILNLPKEISGKAKALLEFNTDASAKLNGKIQFSVDNGSITKLGLVQYLLNVASLFRNPLAMISPTTFWDLVNVPEGTFKKINGTLVIKDNIIERMMIKSSSPQLSAFIIGRINLVNMDASLRIYTKFSNVHKGFSGFLRNISLNVLSKRVKSNAKNDASYYAMELSQLPKLETGEETAQVYLTKFDGDVLTSNFISQLKRIK